MLTRDEQRAVRAWGGAALEALAHPDTHEPSTGASSSTHGLFPNGNWLEYNTKGITVGPLGGPPIVKVTWPQVHRHARALPAELVERIRAHRRRVQRLAMQGHRIFTLAPGYDYMRRAADRDRPEYDRESWEALRDRIWPTQLRASTLLRVQGDRLLDEALPLAVDDEPNDLLELLAMSGAA
ncbi:hypothetical protein [Nocardioides sp. BYT-33-1]|uniref:hypothetical protein n=1 Tax=Nocardioides sp. BYT-33-1 TaxID=3416952 RepID=UPI003F530A7E